MRILILEDESKMGGVQHSTLNFLVGLRSHPEMTPLLLLPAPGPLSEACEEACIPYEYYPKIPLLPSSISFGQDRFRLPNLWGLLINQWHSYRQTKVLISLIKARHPDAVLTKGMGAHFNGGKACRSLGIPCVWHLQDFISERYGGAYQKIFGWLARRYAHRLIADGSPICQQLPADVQEKCTVIFNGVPLHSFYQPENRQKARAALGIPEKAYVVGHLARLTPWKGQHLLLKAFASYAQQDSQAHLLLIGSPLFEQEDFLSYLQNLAQELSINSRVHFPGYRNDLGFVLSAIDTFIYPSIEKDTSPLSLISAMAAGLPIGVSNISGLKEMVEGCSGAVLFENRNLNHIEKTIELFSSPSVRKKAGIVNLEWADKHFSLDSYTKKIVDVLNSISLAN